MILDVSIRIQSIKFTYECFKDFEAFLVIIIGSLCKETCPIINNCEQFMLLI